MLHFLKSHRKRHRKLLESQEYSVVRLLLRVTPAFVMHLLSDDAGTAAKLCEGQAHVACGAGRTLSTGLLTSVAGAFAVTTSSLSRAP